MIRKYGKYDSDIFYRIQYFRVYIIAYHKSISDVVCLCIESDIVRSGCGGGGICHVYILASGHYGCKYNYTHSCPLNNCHHV